MGGAAVEQVMSGDLKGLMSRASEERSMFTRVISCSGGVPLDFLSFFLFWRRRQIYNQHFSPVW